MMLHGRFRLYLLTFGANVLFVSSGAFIVWSSPVVPKLLRMHIITPSQGSWLSSMYSLSAVGGTLCAGLVMDALGRKAALVVNGLLFLLSWLLLAFPQVFPLLAAGRSIGGLGVGASFITITGYVVEIADDSSRQAAGSVNEICIGVGYLIVYCVGPFVDYLVLTGVSAAATLLFLLLALYLPETPYYLVARERHEKAAEALSWIRSSPDTAALQQELLNIRSYVEESKKGDGSWKGLLTRRGPLKALAVCMLLSFSTQITGLAAIQADTQSIFEKTGMEIEPWVGPIWFGATSIVASLFAAPLVGRFGAKNVLVSSTAIMALCQMCLSAYFFCRSQNYHMPFIISISPIFIIMLFNALFCIGVGPLAWMFLAELFPSNLKSRATAVVGTLGWVLGFLIIKTFGDLVRLMGGVYPVFLFFGVSSMSCALVGLFVLPDTRGMTMQDIQDYLQTSHKKRDDNHSSDPPPPPLPPSSL